MSISHRLTSWTRSIATALLLASGAVAVGCANDETFPISKRRRAELALAATRPGSSDASAAADADLLSFSKFSVYASPPAGWTRKVNNAGDDRVEHIVWLSPTQRTAFGVLFFKLPLPVGHDFAFRYGFLAEAEKREGPVTVVDKHWDNDIEGMRFTVDTRKYRVEAKFFVRGMRGWATYAGTRNDMPYEAAEHELAVTARESAEFGEELKPAPATQPSR